MRYLPNGKQMSKADAHTIHEIGIPSLVLMERAALQIVETMHKKNISTDSLVSVPESHPLSSLPYRKMHAEVLPLL